MKKKNFSTSKDKEDWQSFVKDPENIYDKEEDSNFLNYEKTLKTKKIDLHGSSLVEANNKISQFITDSYEQGYTKLLVVTGKGLRSKVRKDPYKSEEMSILKHAVPDYIKNNSELMEKIIKFSSASTEDGEEGAFYIFLKKK